MFLTVSLLAIAGALLGIRALTPPSGGTAPEVVREPPFPGAWAAATSFGEVAVRRLERLPATAPARTHDGHVSSADRLGVAVRLTNRRGAALVHAPGRFRLRVAGNGASIAALGATASSTRLAPGVHDERLTFVVPASSSSFELRFDDLDRRAAVRIDLGSIVVPPDRRG